MRAHASAGASARAAIGATRVKVAALAAAVGAAASLGGVAAAQAPAPEPIGSAQGPPAYTSVKGFARKPLNVRERKLFDLGVSDHDRDGRLDVFTLNHKFASSFKVRRGRRFIDRFARLGLSPTPAFPGLERLFDRPALDRDGVFVWVDAKGRLHLVARGLGRDPEIAAQRVSGSVTFFAGKVRTVLRKRVKVEKRFIAKSKLRKTRVELTLRSGSNLVLKPPFIDLPVQVELEAEIPPERIFVGPRRRSPGGNDFSLRLRDRHGAAWADLDGDSDTDVFIVRGGLSGNSTRFRGLLRDELLLKRDGGRFSPAPGRLGAKGACRGREAGAVDFSGDGRVDLFASCEDGNPRLFRQRSDGSFKVEPAPLKGASRSVDFSWIDLDRDRRPELVSAGSGRINVYRRGARGRWRRIQRLRGPTAQSAATILPAAIDRNALPDLIVLSKAGNAVALNRRGRLRLRSPRSLGLPRASVTGAWVDYNNDGAEDLHLIPQGLYDRSRRRLRFRRAGLMRAAGNVGWAADTWADLDGDGDRDPLIAYKRGGGRIEVVRFANRRARGRWLQVEVSGAKRNRAAFGARVTIRTRGRVQHRWVGAAEGSRFSQGHYRAYFGLGRARRVRRLTVHWPGGGSTTRAGLRANRLVRISR